MRILYRAGLTAWILLSTTLFVQAQLTVFNVSSSDITDQGKISAQQQFEIQDIIESSTALTYGLGRNWEIGLNLVNLDYSVKNRSFEFNDTTTTNPYAPLLLASAQKVFKLNDVFAVGLGGIAGTNITHAHPGHFVYYTYTNLQATLGHEQQYEIAAGPYVSSHSYLGDGPVYGIQAAMDAGIWHNHVHLMADWISGNHPKGKLTMGFEIFLNKRLPLAFGWQRSNADGAQGAVVQLTFLPK